MISIYVNYFASAKIIENDVLKPIQVGAAASGTNLGIRKDDDGENISTRNPAYCEMTGIYWAWKNDLDSDVLGFLHYRRYFDFLSKPSRQIDRHGLIYHQNLNEDLIDEFGLTRGIVAKVMDGHDMLVPVPYNVQSAGPENLRVHYETAPYHHVEDLELAGRILEELSPEYTPHFEAALAGRLLYPNNMFLFSREVFEEYCAWIFPILERLDAEIDTSNYSWQEARAVGYIAERLLTVFILGQKAMKPQIKVKELERVFVRNTAADPLEPPLPDTKKKVMTIVASCDDAYVPHLGALIRSIFISTSPEFFVEFIVLDGGIGRGGQQLIERIGRIRSDASISFIDMRQQHLDLPVHSGFSRATFFRLSIPDLLKKRDKILFLDTDMIVVDDISELIEFDLGGALIAAAPDLVVRAFAEMEVPSLHETGSMKTADYISDYLDMKTDDRAAIENYFQAGTIIMDLAALRASNALRDATKDLSSNVYWFLDQDILNKYLFGKTVFLPGRWNVVWMDDDHTRMLRPADLMIYEESFKNPAIVHYAGVGKPWRNSLNPLSHHYWESLRGTPWYETILFGFLDQRYSGHLPISMQKQHGTGRLILRNIASTIWRALPHWIKAKIWPLANRLKRTIG